MSVEIPAIDAAFAFPLVTIPPALVVECRVHLGCTKEVSSFSLLLQNFDGRFSPGGSQSLDVGMTGYICIGRGSACPLVITCRPNCRVVQPNTKP